MTEVARKVVARELNKTLKRLIATHMESPCKFADDLWWRMRNPRHDFVRRSIAALVIRSGERSLHEES